MENLSTSYAKDYTTDSRAFFNQVFIWMGSGLAVTALISYIVAATPSLLSLIINESGFTILGYIVMFSPLGFVLLMSFGFHRLSFSNLFALFFVYAAINGVSLSFIFMVYTAESIYSTFGTTALMFGGMGLIGYTTKTDLTKMGSILLMALLGIIIAAVINIFIQNSILGFIISVISIVVFCGLTAWDVQKLKNLAADTTIDGELKSKLGMMGALTLYLDFINLFLSMLRIFGGRRD